MKITRRAIAQMLAASAALPVSAAPQSPESNDLAKATREHFEKNAQAMAAVRIPMTTEPPFHFKA